MRKRTRLIIIGCTALLAITLASAPLLIDDETLRVNLVDQLSTALGRPVSIGKLSLKALPHPTLILDNIQLDLGDSPEERIAIGRIHTSLSTYDLIHGKISVKRLDVSKTVLNERRIALLRQLFTGTPETSDQPTLQLPLRLNRARIKEITWESVEGRSFGPFTTTVMWKESLRPDSIEIAQDDNRLKVHLRPVEDRIDFHVHAYDVDPYFAGPIPLDHVDAHGSYHNSNLSVEDATLKAFDGQLKVSGQLSWSKGWTLQGNLEAESMDLPAMLRTAKGTPIPGRVGGNCAISTSAEAPALLFERSSLDCHLKYRNGQQDTLIRLETKQKGAADIGYRIMAQNLTLPVGPPLHAARLKANGDFNRKRLKIESAEIEGYQGTLSGSGELAWGSGWRFDFDARSRNLLIEPILAAFGKKSLNGFLDGDCRGRLAGQRFGKLADRPRLDCNYVITDGILYNTDLERVASFAPNAQQITGNTPFDRLSGKLRIGDGITHLEKLSIQSTALEASGNLTVRDAGALAGNLSVGLKHTNNIVSVPLVVSGTTQDPSLRPTKSALAGGAAGTVLLGPGVGTALGIKVGETLDKLNTWLNPGKRSESTGPQTRE